MRIVVPSPPGGGTDIIARVLAQYFSNALGQQFFVENRPGAGNMIGIESVARAAPDGYTLLFVPSTLALNSVMYKKVSYDPVRDFAPITLAAAANNVLVVNPAVPARTLVELVALAKQKPGQLTYGTPGIGTSPHMSMELLKSLAGIDLQHIPYRGTAPAMTDVISGQINAMFSTALTAKPQIDSGEFVPWGSPVASAARRCRMCCRSRRSASRTTRPRNGTAWWRPRAYRQRSLRASTPSSTQALKSQEMKDKLAGDGAEPVGTTSAEFGVHIKTELEKWAAVARPPRSSRNNANHPPPLVSESSLRMLSSSSGGALAMRSIAGSTSAPTIGLTSIRSFAASSRYCASWWAARNAPCSALARSSGISGGAANGRDSL